MCAIIENVFCSPNHNESALRFKGNTDPLSTYRMEDFCSRITRKNKDNQCSLVLTIAAQYGLVDQESFFNKTVASENLAGYYLLHKESSPIIEAILQVMIGVPLRDWRNIQKECSLLCTYVSR